MKQYLNAAEFARLMNVDRATVTRWIRKGMIKDVRRSPRTKQWQIALSAYEAMCKERV